jgi:biopolymer transport protein ExbB/TolQ
MAVDTMINASSELIPEVVYELGRIGTWLQALGVVVLLWLIFTIVNLIINIKRKKTLKAIREDLERLEKKLDRLSKKK